MDRWSTLTGKLTPNEATCPSSDPTVIDASWSFRAVRAERIVPSLFRSEHDWSSQSW
jgi:hypothetical protein